MGWLNRRRQIKGLEKLLPQVGSLQRRTERAIVNYESSLDPAGSTPILKDSGLEDMMESLEDLNHLLQDLQSAVEYKDEVSVRTYINKNAGIPIPVNKFKNSIRRLAARTETEKNTVVGTPLEDAVLTAIITHMSPALERKELTSFGKTTQEEFRTFFEQGQEFASFDVLGHFREFEQLYKQVRDVFSNGQTQSWHIPMSMDYGRTAKLFEQSEEKEKAAVLERSKQILMSSENWANNIEEFATYRYKEGMHGSHIRIIVDNTNSLQVIPRRPYKEVRAEYLEGCENHLQQLRNNMDKLMAGMSSSHIVIAGPPGTAKSAMVNTIYNEYRPQGLSAITINPDMVLHIPEIINSLDQERKYLFVAEEFTIHDAELLPSMRGAIEGAFEGIPKYARLCLVSNNEFLPSQGVGFGQNDEGAFDDRFGLIIRTKKYPQDTAMNIFDSLMKTDGYTITPEIREDFVQKIKGEGGVSARTIEAYVNGLDATLSSTLQ